jgi:hypothetical protein
MLLSILLVVGAFVLAMAALFYDFAERQFRFAARENETGRFADPVRRLVLVLSLAVVALSVGKAVGDSLALNRAVAEAEHQRQRIKTVFGNPELIIIAEFPVVMLRAAADEHPEIAPPLNTLLALFRETPIPPDACAGVLLAHGSGALSKVGELLGFEGGLSPMDFLLSLGFYRASKDIGGLDKGGVDLFDMVMSANFDTPAVELSYVKAADILRLVISDEADGFSADPDTMTSAEDLLGAVAALEPGNTNSAFQRGYVKAIMLRDRTNKRTFGIDFAALQPAAKDSGWPAGTFVGALGESTNYCIPTVLTQGDGS